MAAIDDELFSDKIWEKMSKYRLIPYELEHEIRETLHKKDMLTLKELLDVISKKVSPEEFNFVIGSMYEDIAREDDVELFNSFRDFLAEHYNHPEEDATFTYNCTDCGGYAIHTSFFKSARPFRLIDIIAANAALDCFNNYIESMKPTDVTNLLNTKTFKYPLELLMSHDCELNKKIQNKHDKMCLAFLDMEADIYETGVLVKAKSLQEHWYEPLKFVSAHAFYRHTRPHIIAHDKKVHPENYNNCSIM